MSKATAYILGILLTLVVGVILYINMCSECALPMASNTTTTNTAAPSDNTQKAVTPQPTAYPFSVKDNTYEFEVNENFNFNVSSAAIKMPIAENVSNGVNSLKSYMLENSNKMVTITGYYTKEERNTSTFPNLGQARANAVKNYLVEQGIPSSQTNIAGKLMPSMTPSNFTYLGPLTFTVDEKAADIEAQLTTLREEILANPLVLYFNTGEASINLSESQRLKVAKITNYLDKVEDAKCLIIGHTDNVGNRNNNIKLGLERANFAKDYFTNNGLPTGKMETTSKGPDQPIANNNTADGKAKNRRVEVTLN